MLRKLVTGCVLVLAACGTPAEDPNAELCEHMKDGPSSAVLATLDGGSAPDVSKAHTRYDVTLPRAGGTGGGFQGSVKFASTHELEHGIALGDTVPLKVFDGSGAEVAISSTETALSCSEVKAKHLVPLKVGTYTLTFGPTGVEVVSVVIEAAAQAH